MVVVLAIDCDLDKLKSLLLFIGLGVKLFGNLLDIGFLDDLDIGLLDDLDDLLIDLLGFRLRTEANSLDFDHIIAHINRLRCDTNRENCRLGLLRRLLGLLLGLGLLGLLGLLLGLRLLGLRLLSLSYLRLLRELALGLRENPRDVVSRSVVIDKAGSLAKTVAILVASDSTDLSATSNKLLGFGNSLGEGVEVTDTRLATDGELVNGLVLVGTFPAFGSLVDRKIEKPNLICLILGLVVFLRLIVCLAKLLGLIDERLLGLLVELLPKFTSFLGDLGHSGATSKIDTIFLEISLDIVAVFFEPEHVSREGLLGSRRIAVALARDFSSLEKARDFICGRHNDLAKSFLVKGARLAESSHKVIKAGFDITEDGASNSGNGGLRDSDCFGHDCFGICVSVFQLYDYQI